jgi:hypothetical protein
MLPSPVRDATQDYIATTRGLTAQAVALILEIRGRTNSPERWRDAVASIGAELLALQVLIAGLADGYLDDVLEAQGADLMTEGAVAADAWMDYVDGGGSLLANLVYAPNSLRRRGLDAAALRERMSNLATTITAGAMQDTGRSSVQTGMQARPAVRGYVRMLVGKSCARCAILAGRTYRRARAFDRHPHCDCRHVPKAEDSDDWTTRPKGYFRSLSESEQNRIFTEAGARAIREGADINQVVNARSGMTTVTGYGRDLQATTTGTTARGLAGQRLQGASRLLPDEIFRLADELGWDRAETLRQLRRFAYIL